ncbi:MAG: outer membrane protein assembly factor BamD [Bacteroidota bacterium]
MKISSLYTWSFVAIIALGMVSCRSEFEKIRTSGDADLLYKKAFEFYEKEDYAKAQTLFELIISGLRGQVEAEKVYFYYAYSHYHQGKYITASYYFKDFVSKFLNSPDREEAAFMSAYSNYKLSPSYRLDQTYTLQAIEGLEQFVNTYTRSERVSEANKLIDTMRKKLERKALAQAELYFDLRQYQASMHTFENMLRDYPETSAAEEIRFKIVEASFLLAENSVVVKQEERFKETIEKYKAFRKKYPTSSYDKDLDNIIKTSTKKLNQLTNDGYQI